MKKGLILSLVFFLILICFNAPNNAYIFAHSQKQFEFLFNNNSFVLDLKSYEINSNIHTILWEANKFSRKKNGREQAQQIEDLIQSGATLEQSFNIVYPALKNDVNNIEKEVNITSENAKMLFKNEKIEIVPEKEGYKLEKNSFYLQLLKNLKIENYGKFDLPVAITKPKYNSQNIKDATFLRSEFQTDISKSSPARKNNIKRAMQPFNNLVIYPNETISFNETTGKRTLKNGYQEAKIIVNGKYVPGFGGGVCQASTTLYNACILSGLKCSANNHSIPPSYVNMGLDAMVNSGTSDLKITNNLELPILIKTNVDEHKINVKIYGANLNGISFKTKTKILEEKPSKGTKIILDTKQEYIDKVKYRGELFIKQRATNGFKTATFLQTYKNNKLIKEQLIRKDIYPPSEGITIEGALIRPILPTETTSEMPPDSNFSQFQF